jgi:hypothetical protein
MNDRRISFTKSLKNPFYFAAVKSPAPWLLIDNQGKPVDSAYQEIQGGPLIGEDGIKGNIPGHKWVRVGRFELCDIAGRVESARRLDRKYRCAVRDSDWEMARCIVDEAAIRAGFRPDIRFHGTDEAFTSFHPGDDGICFVDSLEVAKEYGNKILGCYLRMRKPLRMTYRQWLRSRDPSVEELQEAGKDGIVVSGFQQDEGWVYDADSTMFVVFSPEQVRSADILVRDDAGNIVLPSRRFAPGPDIRGAVEEMKARCGQAREAPQVKEEAGISP